MIEPILLNKNGEKLNDYPNSKGGDEKRLSTPLGVHAICRGWVDISRISETHNAIVCRGCKLRITIPKENKTYGDLRKYLFKKINEGKEEIEIITDKEELAEEGLTVDGTDRLIKGTITLHLHIIEHNEKGTYMTGSKHTLWVKDGENKQIPSLCGDFSHIRLPYIIQNFHNFISKKLERISNEVLRQED